MLIRRTAAILLFGYQRGSPGVLRQSGIAKIARGDMVWTRLEIWSNCGVQCNVPREILNPALGIGGS